MKKVALIVIAVAGLLIGVFGAQPASAACEKSSPPESDPRAHGNEVVGLYVEDVPADYTLLGQNNYTDRVWIEVQDDSRHAPVAVEAGWEGRQWFYNDVHGAPNPFSQILSYTFCTDWVLDEL